MTVSLSFCSGVLRAVKIERRFDPGGIRLGITHALPTKKKGFRLVPSEPFLSDDHFFL